MSVLCLEILDALKRSKDHGLPDEVSDDVDIVIFPIVSLHWQFDSLK